MSQFALNAPEISQLASICETERVACVVKAIVDIAAVWGLTNSEGAALFDVPTATWSRMKSGSYRGNLNQDKVTRASLLIGLFKALRLLFNGPLTYGWPKTANNGLDYDGKTPIEVMISGGIPSIMLTRQHIDEIRLGT